MSDGQEDRSFWATQFLGNQVHFSCGVIGYCLEEALDNAQNPLTQRGDANFEDELERLRAQVTRQQKRIGFLAQVIEAAHYGIDLVAHFIGELRRIESDLAELCRVESFTEIETRLSNSIQSLRSLEATASNAIADSLERSAPSGHTADLRAKWEVGASDKNCTTFRVLLLSDLHIGAPSQNHLLQNVQQDFLRDLENTHDLCQGFDLVLFSGDLVYSGQSSEFELLDRFLKDVFAKLDSLGSSPPLLCVPGNHDLQRPKKGHSLTDWLTAENLRMQFWDSWGKRKKQEARKTVETAFRNYNLWWKKQESLRKGLSDFAFGRIPGDFAATYQQLDSTRTLGIVGINSAFLQLGDGIEEGALSIGRSQFHIACRAH